MAARQDQHIEAARLRLTHLAALGAETEEAERRILAGATARLEQVEGDLNKLRGRAVGDDGAGEQFERLMLERGQLQIVISSARQALGE